VYRSIYLENMMLRKIEKLCYYSVCVIPVKRSLLCHSKFSLFHLLTRDPLSQIGGVVSEKVQR
jgi:hypothetical protein